MHFGQLLPLPEHLVATNEAPTDDEAAQVLRAMEESRARIIQLDRAISALQSIIEKHRRARQAASDQIRRGTLILSVSRRLPTDILVEIFNWTVPDEAARKRPTARSPWLLGRVCSRWRALSLHLPELWTTIDRNIPLAMVKAHLDRSHPHPLTVELGYSDSGSVELLVQYAARWESADVEMRAFMGPALVGIHGRLPRLRRLKYNDNNGFRGFGAFAVAPALRDVALSGKASLALPWGQLERLNMKLSDSAGLADLRLACNLVELTVTGRPPGQAPTAMISTTIMELPRLRTLLIKDGGFLKHLLLPALEDCYVSMELSAVPALLERSACTLRRFTTDVQCQPGDIFAIIERAPALVELRVTAVTEIHVLLAALTISPNAYERPMLPALRTLVVSNVADAAACAQVRALMESRRRSSGNSHSNNSENNTNSNTNNPNPCPELSLCVFDWIKWGADLNLHVLETLGVLREKGFDVEWFSGPQSMERYRSWRVGYP
ncbi:hypothetical protein B0H11DRAFT_2259182 [Mycena galericulata]|nr:hypothetical protein B0H11DRAFT_2259182 [Mycena galericulata]